MNSFHPSRLPPTPPHFIQIPKPPPVNQESIPMPANIEQISLADFVLALTYEYSELGLPLDAALRAAAADLL
jgi:hypothetical protein